MHLFFLKITQFSANTTTRNDSFLLFSIIILKLLTLTSDRRGGGHLQYFTNLKVSSNDDCEPPVHSSTDHRYGAVRHLSLDYYTNKNIHLAHQNQTGFVR